jgi:hypothetical protein
MNKKFYFIGALVLTGTLVAGIFLIPNSQKKNQSEQALDAVPSTSEITTIRSADGESVTEVSAYKKAMFEVRKNPNTGLLTEEDILQGIFQVREARDRQFANSQYQRSLGLDWELLGPTNVGGRTRAMMFDQSNPDRVYAGSVSGGLFFSDNGGLTWTSHPDNYSEEGFKSNLISSIDQAANGDIYVGTGEQFIGYYDGSFGAFTHGFTGNGIYKSTDGGATFRVLDATEPTPGTLGSTSSTAWGYVNRVACHPTDNNIVMAGTNRGLKYSTDGGASWNDVNADGTNLIGAADDVVFDANGIWHALHNDTYYKGTSSSDPSAGTGTVGEGLPSASAVRRGVLAVAPSDPNYVYMYAADNTEALLGVYQSTDGGETFSTIAGTGSTFFNPPGGQGNYNLCIEVNPADPGRVYIGGQIDAWSWNEASGNWDQMAAAFFPNGNPKYIHADHHFFAFHPSNPNIMIFGTDGGVYRTLNALDQFPDWQDFNKSYSTMQMHGVAGGFEGEAMGGSQDNGTAYLDYTGNSLGEARRVLGGDGGEAEISKVRPSFLFASFFDFANGGGALRRSLNDGNSWASMFDDNIDPNLDGVAGGDFWEADYLWEDYDRGFLFNPVLTGDMIEYPAGSGTMVGLGDVVTYDGETFELNPENVQRSRFFYGAPTGSLWMTNQALKNSTEGPPVWFQVASGVSDVTAVHVTADGDHAYFGNSAGSVYRLDGLNSATYEYVFGTGEQWFPDSAGITRTLIGSLGSRVTGVEVDQNDDNHVVASTGGYGDATNVHRSTNAATSSASFTSISSGLPNIPAFDCMIDFYNGDNILVATEFGVWSYDASNPGGGWTQEIEEIGSVPTFEIRQEVMRETQCRPIYIGTHGRGMWRAINNVDIALGCDFEIRGFALGDDPIQENIIGKISLAPNPADESSRLGFNLEESGRVQISVYDLSGRQVLVITNGANLPAGDHNFSISTNELKAGNYLVVIQTETGVKSTKMAVMH